MALESDNVRVIDSTGATCFVCDGEIHRGERSIEVSFQLVFTIRKELHPGKCVKKLVGILEKASREASK